MNNPQQDWQQWMLDCVINPQQLDGDKVNEKLTSSGQLSVSQSLAIYQRGYILRLTKCLAEQFPALCAALGEELFNRFARRYLNLCPSKSYTLYELGSQFPEFLQQDRPDKDLPPQKQENWIDFMVDLARYERLHFSLFDAPGHEGNAWPAIDTPDEQLTVQPCFALAEYQFPVAWYYHAVKENPQVNLPPKQPSYIALARTNYQVTTYPINQFHFEFLNHLKQHGNVAGALLHLCKLTKIPMDKVGKSWHQEVKGRWINAGFFVHRSSA